MVLRKSGSWGLLCALHSDILPAGREALIPVRQIAPSPSSERNLVPDSEIKLFFFFFFRVKVFPVSTSIENVVKR